MGSLSGLSHKLLAFYQKNFPDVRGKFFLLACSGGRDSVASFHLHQSLIPILGWRLVLAYVHHGCGEESELNNYRNASQAFVRELAEKANCSFLTESSTKLLKSEDEMRSYRRSVLSKWASELKDCHIITAHHLEDLLETQLIQMIRGCGSKGLQSLKPINHIWIRPFLKTSVKDLEDYLVANKFSWIEDPSNQDVSYLRNWVREIWLKQLSEAQGEKAVANLGRSLGFIMASSSECTLGIEGDFLDTSIFWSLSESQKSQVLANYFRNLGLKNYTYAHILEMQKRLTSTSFKSCRMLGYEWNLYQNKLSGAPYKGGLF